MSRELHTVFRNAGAGSFGTVHADIQHGVRQSTVYKYMLLVPCPASVTCWRNMQRPTVAVHVLMTAGMFSMHFPSQQSGEFATLQQHKVRYVP
jgi:hypothetical protein